MWQDPEQSLNAAPNAFLQALSSGGVQPVAQH